MSREPAGGHRVWGASLPFALTPRVEAAIGLLACALVVRLLCSLYVVGLNEPGFLTFPDAEEYDAIAVALVQERLFGLNHEPSTFRPPGYPLFLARVYALFGHSYAAVKVVQAGLGAVTCLLILLIGERVFGWRTGCVAAGLAAIYPALVIYTGYLLSETLFVLLACLFLYALVRLREAGALRWAFVAGLVLGAMSLVRPVALLLPVLVFGWTLLEFRSMVRGIAITAVTVGCMALVILPWTARNYARTGSFVLIASHHWGALYGANNPAILKDPEAIGGWLQPESGSDYREGYLAFLRDTGVHDPAALLNLELHKLKRFWSVSPKTSTRDRVATWLSYGLLLPFILAGVWLSFRRGRTPWLLVLWVLYFNVLALIFYGSTRFRLPVEPVLLLFGALALVRLVERWKIWADCPPTEVVERGAG